MTVETVERQRPELFFKYTTRSTAEIVLKTSALRWSTPALLNDPYDIQFDMHLEVDAAKLRRLALDKSYDAWYGAGPYVPAPGNIQGELVAAYRDKFPKLTREQYDSEFGQSIVDGLQNALEKLPERHIAIRKLAARAKILCQSEVGNSLPMWAYYAEQHKGVVLRFKPRVDLDSIWLVAKPVVYSHTMPRLFDEEFLSDLSAGTRNIDTKQLLDRTVYTKSIEWAHEREWRLHMGAGRDPNSPYEDLKFHPYELDAVILGCVMPQDDRDRIMELARSLYSHAAVLQACKHEREFKLVMEDVI